MQFFIFPFHFNSIFSFPRAVLVKSISIVHNGYHHHHHHHHIVKIYISTCHVFQRGTGEVDLYCTQRVRSCRQLHRVQCCFLHPLLFQVNIPVVLCSDIISQNIVDNSQLSYRATWAVLPWTIVVLAWISLLPRIASIKVFYFYKST